MNKRPQPDLFMPALELPEGFDYRDDVITTAEEADYVHLFAALPFKPFEFHGYLGNRRVVSFGWRYDYAGRALRESNAIPDFLLPLRMRAASFADIPADSLQQILVTEYTPGAGIGWHRDKPMFQDVIAISFVSTCTLRLRRKTGNSWERKSQVINPRSAYLLRGPVRKEWEHSVPHLDALRYFGYVPKFREWRREKPMTALWPRKRCRKPLEIYSQLYVGDYFSDTLRLSANEHAAFCLHLLHLWLSEPTDRELNPAKIAGVSAREWRAMAPLLLPLLTIARSNIATWKAALRVYDGMRLPSHEWHTVRAIVLERDEYTCQYCGSLKRLHVDHKIPLARGGSNAFDNLVTACGPCNQSKGAKLPCDWNEKPSAPF